MFLYCISGTEWAWSFRRCVRVVLLHRGDGLDTRPGGQCSGARAELSYTTTALSPGVLAVPQAGWTVVVMASKNVFLEEAVALRDDLASVLRSQPPASLEELDDLEFTLGSTEDIELSLLASGLDEARSIAESITRIRAALFTVRDEAVRSDIVRSQAVRSLLRRVPTRETEPDATLATVAVASLDALPLEARVLMEYDRIGTGRHGGTVSSIPRWVLSVLTDTQLESAGIEEITDTGTLMESEIREVAFALWDPASELPLRSFEAALDTASRIV